MDAKATPKCTWPHAGAMCHAQNWILPAQAIDHVSRLLCQIIVAFRNNLFE